MFKIGYLPLSKVNWTNDTLEAARENAFEFLKTLPDVEVLAPDHMLALEGSSTKILVVNADGEHVVRLDKIAAPSAKNPDAPKIAVKFLHDLVDGKDVEVLWTKRKKGDISGVVYYKHPQGIVEVNLTLVKNGCAKQSIYDNTAAYDAAEKDARRHGRGMWSVKCGQARSCRQDKLTHKRDRQ